jgi:hypothetical protein
MVVKAQRTTGSQLSKDGNKNYTKTNIKAD